MGKKIVKLTESELINLVRKVIREQKISDLPQNQQSLTPKPNLSSTKSKDLRSTLTPQQQQQVKDITRGRNDLSKQYYSNQTTNKTDNYKVDDHTLNTILSIGAAFIPVVGPFISAGIMLNDAAQYYNEGDSKTAGMMAMFALLPGTGAVISKVPGVKQLGANGMKTLATKLSTKAPLSKLESEVVAGLSANQSLVQQELSKLTAETAKKTAQAVTNQTTKQSLVNIGKKGLVFTGKNVAPYVAAGVAYDKAYDSLNPESEVDLASALDVDISQIPEKATLEIEF